MRIRAADSSKIGFSSTCPYCGETIEIYVEPDIEGSLVQDCEVCCNPWRVEVPMTAKERAVYVSRADGSSSGAVARRRQVRSLSARIFRSSATSSSPSPSCLANRAR